MNNETLDAKRDDEIYSAAIVFIQALMRLGIPLSAIDTNDFHSNTQPAVYVTIPYGFPGGGKFKRYIAKTKHNAINAVKFYRKYVPWGNPAERDIDVAIDFRDGRPTKGHGSISATDITMYSYNEPIGYRKVNNDGSTIFFVNMEKYSVMTSKHISYLRRALAAAGYKPTNFIAEFPSSYISSGTARFKEWK